MSNLSVENVYTRKEAKDLAKAHFWKLLGMMAIVFGISYAISMGGNALLAAAGNETVMLVGYVAIMIIASLLSGGLMLGLVSVLIALCRGNTVGVGTVFSRMGQCLKAFGLGLWVGLKSVLWMLPGYVLVIAGVVMASGMSTSTSPEDAAGVMTLVMVAGMVLIFALVIPAVLRYMLSTYILADHPETGVFECVRQSKTLMKGHKWQAFKLIVPIFLVMYVVMIVLAIALTAVSSVLANSAVLASILGAVMGIGMLFVMLYYMIRMYLCYTIFYLKRVAELNPVAQPEAPAEDDITSTITF